MSRTHLDAPLFIQKMEEETVDIDINRYFYNADGVSRYLPESPSGVTPLTPATTDPAVAIGSEYVVPGVLHRQSRAPWGMET